MVNQILLRGFLPEGELTEYQKFIWEKINSITGSDSLSSPYREDYAQIKQFLRSLTREQIDSFFAKRDLHCHHGELEAMVSFRNYFPFRV